MTIKACDACNEHRLHDDILRVGIGLFTFADLCASCAEPILQHLISLDVLSDQATTLLDTKPASAV